MIWPASCGISATGLRMRSRMSVLTRFISSCNRVFSRSSEALGGDFSSRACTATATRRLFPCLTEPHVQASIEPSLEGSSPSAWTTAHIDLRGYRKIMRELLRTNDTVRLSWLQAMLASAGIEAVILDTHTSILEG